MPIAPINGIELYFESHGSGSQTIVLLHGCYGSIESFRHIIPELTSAFRIIAVDSRAQGRSSDSDALLSYDLMASDVKELLDYLKIDRVHIAGWSDGGIIGLEFAIRFPDRILSLISMSANFAPDGLTESNIELIDQTTVETLGPSIVSAYKKLSPHPELLPLVVEKLKYMLLTEPKLTREDLGKISCPTLILSGADDEFIRKDHTEELCAAVPNAVLQLVPDSGHFLLIEAPNIVAKAVVDFVSRHQSRT